MSLWCPSTAGVQEELTSAEPRRFFRPPASASASGIFSHWIGVYLDLPDDDGVDWDEIAEILGEAYRIVAPRRLVALLDDADGRRGGGR